MLADKSVYGGVKIRDFEIWTWNNEPFFLIDKVWLE